MQNFHWFPSTQHWRLPENRQLRQWLQDPGSMTTRLEAFAGSKITVNILCQSWQLPTEEERQVLQLPTGRYCLIREVELQAQDRVLLWARSVLPEGRLTKQFQYLPQLRKRTIGRWFFADPHLQRSPFSYKLFTERDTLFAIPDRSLWGRRSLFMTKHQQMLLTEVLMPELYS